MVPLDGNEAFLLKTGMMLALQPLAVRTVFVGVFDQLAFAVIVASAGETALRLGSCDACRLHVVHAFA